MKKFILFIVITITLCFSCKERERRFKMWVKDMQNEFSGYKLKHVLEYGDISYDIVLESKDGKTIELTPCFDIQFNENNKIVAFGW